MNFVYLLECRDKSFYCGYTINLSKRIELHNQRKGAKYTKSRLPVKFIYFEEFNSKSNALKREIEIKSLTRKEKELLCLNKK
jgi:putative endonuclease